MCMCMLYVICGGVCVWQNMWHVGCVYVLICVYDVATSVTCNTCADTRESHQHARTHIHKHARLFLMQTLEVT